MRGGSEIPVEQTSTSDNPQPSGTVILVKARQLNESRTEANGQSHFDRQGENTVLLLGNIIDCT